MGGEGSQFPSTHWSLILDVRTQDETRRRLATENLIAGYWKPVYCYLRKRGYGNEEAKDLTQDFFCEFFLGSKLLQTADKKIGRFRQLLLTALKRFISNVERDKKRKKRAPAQGDAQLIVASVRTISVCLDPQPRRNRHSIMPGLQTC
jgi:hypothetical protein